MKNRKTNIIKLGILLFGITLLLWNCQKDYQNNETAISDNHPKPKIRLNNNIKFEDSEFNEIKENPDFNKLLSEITLTKQKKVFLSLVVITYWVTM